MRLVAKPMGKSPIKFYYKKKSCGLTLIEVLIALAIISIALTAIIKTTVENIRATRYLQDKMLATWVGQQVINEARVDLINLANENVEQATNFLGRNWYWQANEINTANLHIKKITVKVFATEDNKATQHFLVNLESYVYQQ